MTEDETVGFLAAGNMAGTPSRVIQIPARAVTGEGLTASDKDFGSENLSSPEVTRFIGISGSSCKWKELSLIFLMAVRRSNPVEVPLSRAP